MFSKEWICLLVGLVWLIVGWMGNVFDGFGSLNIFVMKLLMMGVLL